jgi:hypothetical protein
MSELKLTPGWLNRDVARASQQATNWQAAKNAPREERSASRPEVDQNKRGDGGEK